MVFIGVAWVVFLGVVAAMERGDSHPVTYVLTIAAVHVDRELI